MYLPGSDKSLARPGRKQVRKHARDARDFNIKKWAVIKFFFFCKARRWRKFTPFWQKQLVSFLVGLRTYQHPCTLYTTLFLVRYFPLHCISPIHTNFQETGFKVMKSKLFHGHPCGFNILDLVSIGSNITCLHFKYVEIQMAEVTQMDMNPNTFFFTLSTIFSCHVY